MSTITQDSKKVRLKAMDLLARREHGHTELARKLTRYDFEPDVIAAVLDQLAAEGLLSDQRFIESYSNSRRNSGFGPIRIREELRTRGISAEAANTVLDESDTIWFRLAAEVRTKRFGPERPTVFVERAKQMQFLQYRGFNQQHIDTALGSD